MINYELTDPRVGEAAVVEVHISPDLRHAHVRLALRGTPGEQRATLEAIDHAKQFLRHQLAERLQLFHTPDLQFEAALPAQLSAKIPQTLKRIRRGRPKSEENSIS